MADSLTPEEKLLRLIKGQKKDAARHPEPAAAPVPHARQAAPSQEKQPAVAPLAPLAYQRALRMLASPRALAIGLCAAAAYLAFTLAYPVLAPLRAPLQDAEKQTVEAFTTQPSLQKPLEYYSQAPASRQLFSGSGVAAEDGAGQAATPEMLRDINLVGIITGDKPQAVIEDKKTQKTYYAAKGQSIGEYTVADIQEGKIIIHYKGSNFEVYL